MRIVEHLLYKISGNLPARLIPSGTGPYLERYYVGKFAGVTFYLHRFVSSDSERHVHNHPWKWARALVLSGAYIEDVVTDLCTHADATGCLLESRTIRWWNRIDGNHFHRIAEARPGTWTLFFHGPRVKVPAESGEVDKGWGFLEAAYGVGFHAATVYHPYPVTFNAWWSTAPKGRDSDREPPRVRMSIRQTLKDGAEAVVLAATVALLGASITAAVITLAW